VTVEKITVRCAGHPTSAGVRQTEVVTAIRDGSSWTLKFPYGSESQPLDADGRPIEGIAALVPGASEADRLREPLRCPFCRANAPAHSRERLYAAFDLLAAAGRDKVDLPLVQRALAAVNRGGVADPS
jgi:hypothetical protein